MSKKIDDATATMIRNLEEKSGRTLAQWAKVVAGLGLQKHGEIVKALKSEHGLGHGYANLVAHHAKGAVSATGGAAVSGNALVDAMYSGPKADLRPIYDALLTQVKALGKDVEISPKKTYVSLRRSKQFGLVQPTTRTRVDVGLNLKGVKPSGRLEASGSFNSMVTHRVRLETAADVDKQLVGWLKDAYRLA